MRSAPANSPCRSTRARCCAPTGRIAKALIGNPEIADILPLTDQSLYVLGKKMGTTSLTLYDRRNLLIAVIDIAVGPDVTSLKRQLSELMPNDQVGARISNDSVILEGTVSSGPAADRAVQVAETYAPGKVVNLLSIGSAQQVMLEVRFSEIKRGALKDLGLSGFVSGSGDHGFQSAFGSGANFTSSTGTTTTTVTDRSPARSPRPTHPTRRNWRWARSSTVSESSRACSAHWRAQHRCDAQRARTQGRCDDARGTDAGRPVG